jgi:hypothetical protein
MPFRQKSSRLKAKNDRNVLGGAAAIGRETVVVAVAERSRGFHPLSPDPADDPVRFVTANLGEIPESNPEVNPVVKPEVKPGTTIGRGEQLKLCPANLSRNTRIVRPHPFP